MFNTHVHIFRNKLNMRLIFFDLVWSATNTYRRKAPVIRQGFRSFVGSYRKLLINFITIFFTDFCFILSCCLWLSYGRLTGDHSVTLVNVIGCSLFFLYTMVYYVFTVNKTSILKQFSLAAIVLLCSIGYINYEPRVETAIQTIGIQLRFLVLSFVYNSN